MRIELRPDEITVYRGNGFLVVPDLFTEAEIAELEATIAESIRERDGRPLPRPLEEYPIGEQFGNPERQAIFDQHLNLWETSPRMRAFTLDPRLGRLACELEGIDAVRIWQDTSLVKPAWGAPTGWHIDTPLFPFTSDHAISFWIPLADATLLNGCVHYIPGSHHRKLGALAGFGLDGLRDMDPAWARTDPVPCPVERGGMVIHNGYTAHAANGNITPHARQTFAISYMPDGATFNGTANILSHAQLSRLRIGDPLTDDEANPIAFSRAGLARDATRR